MRSHYFQVGDELTRGGAAFRIDALLVKGDQTDVQLRRLKTGEIITANKEKLEKEYGDGKLWFDSPERPSVDRSDEPLRAKSLERPLKAMPSHIRERSIRRRTYLNKLHQRGALRFDRTKNLEQAIDQVAKDIGDARAPSRATIWRWNQQWVRKEWRLSSIVDRRDRRGGSGKGRAQDDVEELIVEVINEHFLTLQRNSVVSTYRELERRISLKNESLPAHEHLELPSLRTIHRRIKSLNAYEVMARRHGERAAKRYFRAVTGTVKPRRALEGLEFDHTPLNLFVIDERTYLPLGRPTFTAAICRSTRACLGHWISFTGHGADAVLECLRHVIRPKLYVVERYPEIQLGWSMYGVPNAIYVDNGLEFTGEDLAAACADLGIDLFYLPVRRPEWKGRIERFLRTFNHSLIHTIPGTTFEKIAARGDYDPMKHALITLGDLERIVHLWICDVYHNERHRGLNERPIDAWSRLTAIEPPPMLDDVSRLDFILGEGVERTLFHYGVELHGGNQRYNSKALALVRAACGNVRVRVRYHRADIGRCWVEHPVTKEYLEVPNIDPDYSHGLTLEQHQFIVRRAKADAEGRVNRKALLAAKGGIQSTIQKLLDSKLLRERRHGARLAGKNSGEARRKRPDDLRAAYCAQQQESQEQQQAARRSARSAQTAKNCSRGQEAQGTAPRRAAPPRFKRRPAGGAAA